MTVGSRDLGVMPYKECWDLQQSMFDALVERKAGGKTEPGTEAGDKKDAAEDLGDQKKPGRDARPEKNDAAIANAGSDYAAATDTASCGEDEADEAGTILLVEHPPVYTLGKSGHAENLLIGREALERMGAEFFHIDRGGDITFHGPGQLVCYPILDLEMLGIGLRTYIEALEEAVIRTVAHYGIEAGRIEGASGVWVGGKPAGDSATDSAMNQAMNPATGAPAESVANCVANRAAEDTTGGAAENAARSQTGSVTEGTTAEGATTEGVPIEGVPAAGATVKTAAARPPRKVCAIGVRSSRYITMHGFALNVTTDLGWFARINPCGFTDRGVTSIAAETGREVSMDEVKSLVTGFLEEILNVKIYNK